MLGIGALGEACARALQALHFTVEGWSRAPKSLPGIVTHHGRDGLKAALQGADLIVTLLPRTTAFGYYDHNMVGLIERFRLKY